MWVGWKPLSVWVKPRGSAPAFGWPSAERSVERRGDSGLVEESSAE